MEKFSVLIPAYNEEKNIILTITETIKVFEDFKKDYEIIVIDDGSTDNTCNLVKKNLPNFNNKVKLESYTPNKGKGYTLKYGFNFASGDYILFLDADLDLHPSQLVNLSINSDLEALLADKSILTVYNVILKKFQSGCLWDTVLDLPQKYINKFL